MRIRISDLMEKSCPEAIELGSADRDMIKRIDAQVLEKIGAEHPKPRRVRRKTLSAVLLAAVIVLLLGSAAYAASAWFMNLRKTDTPETGYWRETDGQGVLLNEQKITFPDAGLVLTFEGPAERKDQPEFRCWYLPSEATFGFTDAEGWTNYLSDNGEGSSIPYIVGAGNVRAGNHRRVINGDVTLVKEENWGDWQVTMLTSDYTNCTGRWVYDRANYVLLFHPENGWLVTVTGTDDLETLLHIARELEIRDSGEPAFGGEDNMVESIGMLDPGRG